MAITKNDIDALNTILTAYTAMPYAVNATVNQASILRNKLEKLMAGQRLKHARDDDEWQEANGNRANERRRVNGSLTPAQQRAIAPYIDEGRA